MSMTMEQVVTQLQQELFTLRAEVAAESGLADAVRAINSLATAQVRKDTPSLIDVKGLGRPKRSSSCGASACLCLLLCIVAGVAVQSIRLGHQRAACARSGVLGRREFALESAAARICREAGRRVSTNCLMRDLVFPLFPTDSRRLEVVVEGLPFFGVVSWLSTPHWCARCTVMAPS